ncbi:calcium channel flower isoform X1 [Dendroctonus ponderosae]|uniref:Calcium channel flower n=1 Tax=Dendroctonus ponderosae TaxID=77166 RepID=A0AAR5PRG9_DENPD|nr:calcium channel flower isoform X1 [Dendroctonus ponderosae]KAH1014051.1 hypothetical protein HUJ04_002947 [Dendroctonus ponderosae]
MSFQDKISALMVRPGQDPVSKDEIPWWLKFAGRGLGTVGGILAVFLGVWSCLGILVVNVSALIAGMLQVVVGFIVLCVEAPCCCMFVENVQRMSDFVDSRPFWNRAAGYVVLAIPPIIIEPSVTIILGSGLIFGTGVLYGMMALGKKASREDMAAVASPQMATSPSGLGGHVDHQRATLVEDPDVWRPT